MAHKEEKSSQAYQIPWKIDACLLIPSLSVQLEQLVGVVYSFSWLFSIRTLLVDTVLILLPDKGTFYEKIKGLG
jgi:hypothetical protein